VVPSTNQQPLTQISVPAVEKGEASSTTCSPKLDSAPGLHSKLEIATVEETDSDPNVTSTTKDIGVEKKKQELLTSKDPIKMMRKDLDSLSYRDKKEIKEELFAPTLIQSTPKLLKKQLDPTELMSRDKRSKDTPTSKDKQKLKDKHKHKMKHDNDLKDLFSATATIRKETVKKEDKKGGADAEGYGEEALISIAQDERNDMIPMK